MTRTEQEPATKEKAIVLTIEVESGRIYYRPINNAEPSDIKTVDQIRAAYGNFGAGFDTVCLIVRSKSSPECLQLIGGSLVNVC
jgi:hypothetical protein